MPIDSNPDHSWESGYRPYCLRCDTMYRMERRDYGWQCAHDNCKNMIDKDGLRIQQEGDNRPDRIRNADRAGKHGLYYSMIECRYSEEGPPKSVTELIRRIGEAARLLRDVSNEHEAKKVATVNHVQSKQG